MRDRFYSTAALARVCGVSISTIKRWTDAGLLRCVRTPGGHRKFRLQDVAEAGRRLGLAITDPDERPGARLDELALLLLQGNTAALAEHVGRSLLAGDGDATRALLLDLHRHGMALSDVAQLLAGACRELRNAAHAGSLNDFGLRRAHQLAAAAARSLAENAGRSRNGAPRALLASIARRQDALPASLALLLLSACDWNALDLGSEVGPSILRGALESERPDLVVLLHDDACAVEGLVSEVEAAGAEALPLDTGLQDPLEPLRRRALGNAVRFTASLA